MTDDILDTRPRSTREWENNLLQWKEFNWLFTLDGNPNGFRSEGMKAERFILSEIDLLWYPLLLFSAVELRSREVKKRANFRFTERERYIFMAEARHECCCSCICRVCLPVGGGYSEAALLAQRTRGFPQPWMLHILLVNILAEILSVGELHVALNNVHNLIFSVERNINFTDERIFPPQKTL